MDVINVDWCLSQSVYSPDDPLSFLPRMRDDSYGKHIGLVNEITKESPVPFFYFEQNVDKQTCRTKFVSGDRSEPHLCKL